MKRNREVGSRRPAKRGEQLRGGQSYGRGIMAMKQDRADGRREGGREWERERERGDDGGRRKTGMVWATE